MILLRLQTFFEGLDIDRTEWSLNGRYRHDRESVFDQCRRILQPCPW